MGEVLKAQVLVPGQTSINVTSETKLFTSAARASRHELEAMGVRREYK